MGNASAWVAACRPKTLLAGAVPVIVGTGLAYDHGVVAWAPAAAALVGALLIQVGTNLANDYYDHVKGADTPDRLGMPRASASGQLPASHVRNAAYTVFASAGVVGLYLTWAAGWEILVVGVVSILFGILYTAGPKPLGYIGLGDLLVFVFFGPVAVAGTYYVQALTIHPVVVAAGVPIGALATAILVVNNLRDIATDRATGKRTLAVRIGTTATKAEYVLLLLLAYAGAAALAYADGTLDAALLLPFLTLPVAGFLVRDVVQETELRRHNRHLEATARLMGMFGVLLALGWFL